MSLRATSSSGSGLPAGGTTAQALIKNSNANGDAGWATLAGGGNALTTSSLAQFAATTSAELAGVISNETGTGALVFATAPLITLPNATGLPIATGVSGLATGAATFLTTPTSANLAALMTDETGTGANVFATGPTITLPNATGLPLTTGVTGILPVANGGSGTATPAIVAGTNVTVSGTWPNQTVNATGGGGGNVSNSGTPTSGQVGVWVTATTIQGVTATGTGSPVLGTAPTISAANLTGIVATNGSNVTTANAMSALAIDVTLGFNTKSIAADSTFTFSGTPATANTWFQLYVTNTDTNPHTLTLPSAFSVGMQGASTTTVIPASGQLLLTWRYDGSAYHIFGDAYYLNNFSTTTNPSTSNDVTQGYGPGSLWGNTTANTLYWCETNASGAAVWNLVAGTGTGDMLLASAQTNTGAKTFNDSTLLLAGSTSGTLTLHAQAVAGTGTVTFPVAGGNLGYLESPINSQSTAYTFVLADSGKTIYHPTADTTARVFTIPANASVAYPVGTCICVDNDVGAGAVTLAITTDTNVLVGTAGTTGSLTIAAGQKAIAQKVTSTRWRTMVTAYT